MGDGRTWWGHWRTYKCIKCIVAFWACWRSIHKDTLFRLSIFWKSPTPLWTHFHYVTTATHWMPLRSEAAMLHRPADEATVRWCYWSKSTPEKPVGWWVMSWLGKVGNSRTILTNFNAGAVTDVLQTFIWEPFCCLKNSWCPSWANRGP